MIPQSFIQELLARVDVVDVVGRSVQLKKAGANFQGLCPFHSEKSPSFTVSPSKQFYHCFGCGAHGSAVGFLMEHQGLSYVDAIKDLASAAGLTVPEEKSFEKASERATPDLYELMALAEKFYRNRLKDNQRAINYFKGRGLSGQTAAHFGLGYAPKVWQGLEAAVPDYRNPDLVKAGLVIEADEAEADQAEASEAEAIESAANEAEANEAKADKAPNTDSPNERRRWDRFRDRVMFPIRNPRGQTIGFGGRILDEGEPKYLNSPETPLFSKGRELYGLFEGREALRKENTAIVVEGYMDVVMLAEHGVGNAVATLGTATTPDHVRKLTRLVDRIVFSFDGDKAGRKAAWRALESCLPQLSDTKKIDFLFLPAEHDPDSYVKEYGQAAFREMLNGASSFSAFLLATLEERCDIGSAEGRAQFLAQARPLIQAMPEIAFKLQMQRQIAIKASVSDAELQRFLAAAQPNTQRDQGRPLLNSNEGVQEKSWKPKKPNSGWTNTANGWKKDKPDRLAIGSVRSKAGPVALIGRCRLLTLLHPTVASKYIEYAGTELAGDIPQELASWLPAVAACSEGSFASLCDVLRSQFAQEIEQAQIAAASDKEELAAMSFPEAMQEFSDGCRRLRERALRAEQQLVMDQLHQGVVSEALSARYREITSLIIEISKP